MAQHLDTRWLEQSLMSLRRQDTSGFGSGLSRTLATRVGVDVLVVRAAFVVLALCSGFGVALYFWGTLLTVGSKGTRPIDSWIPRFSSWSRGAQIGMVVGSTIALVAAVGALTSLPWGLAVLAAVVIFWLVRRQSPQVLSSDSHVQSAPADEGELIEQWRDRMSAALGQRHEPRAMTPSQVPPPSAEVSRPPMTTKTAWLAAAPLLAGCAAIGVVAGPLLGLSVPSALAIASIALGLGSVVFAACARSRRLPRPFLVPLIVALVMCGWIAGRAAPDTDEVGTRTFTAYATESTIDLTEVKGYDTIEVIAVASSVEVIVPDLPEDGVHTVERLGVINIEGDATEGSWPVQLVIESNASSVTVKEAS